MKTFLALVIVITFVSCSKDAAIPQNNSAAAIPNYIPMTVGSYWVYDWYVVDSLGNATPQFITDSVYIEADTIIGADTFAIKVGTWHGMSPFRAYLRNSNGDLMNTAGGISFSATNYIDTLYTWYPTSGGTIMGYCKMIDIGEMVTVPAGTFRTLNAAYVVVNLVGTWGCIGIYDIHDKQYAENVGMERTSFQYTPDAQCRVFEGRLRTYHIN